MGQFKPMVKMMTTEPSVVLKLKKGGHVNTKAAKKAEHGHKPMGKMDGGVMGALAGTPALVGRPAVNAPVAAPGRPSMAARRKAMMAKPMATPMMKEGGDADLAQDKAMIKKAMKQHDAQEHKGGKGTKLKLKTGGVPMGPGGYKDGGKVAKSGIIKSEKGVGPYNTTEMHEDKPDNNSAPTGEVKLGNGGGYKRGGKVMKKATGGVMKSTKPGEYKKGGAVKKFADGGRVQDDGRPVKMPKKAASDPVSISRLSGTFKKGGSVKKKAEGGPLGTQPNKEEQGEAAWRAGEKSDNEAMRNAMNPMQWFKPLVDKLKGSPAAVVETTKSKTVVPAKKKYGGMSC
jgi:hypothetical protein